MEGAVLQGAQPLTPEQMQELFSKMLQTNDAERLAQAKDNGFTKSDFQQEKVKEYIYSEYDFVRVRNVGQFGTIYYLPKDGGSAHELKDVDALKIVREAYMHMFNMAPASKMQATIDTLKMGVSNEVESINNEVVRVADTLYWDTRDGRLTETPTSMCMRELFDSRGTREIKIDINDVHAPFIMSAHRKIVRVLEETDGLIEPGDPKLDVLGYTAEHPVFKTFMTWANNDLDTFNDLLKATATNFMYNKPKGAFVLIGLKRNGKSTYIKLLHALFGRNNTSSVRLSDFNNHGLNGELWTTMMNAPDEEDEGRGKDLLEAQGNFKSIAAHESLKLRKLYEQNGQWVNSDFMCFFPMNHFPEWKGNGAAACMHRTLPLFFNNDLSKYDNNGKDFATETYTSGFFETFIPLILAIATYYHDRPISFSNKMKQDQEKVAEEVDNISLYLDRFKSWFNGYKSKKLVYEDYKLWCQERDLRWQDRSVFSHTLEMRGPKVTSFVDKDRKFNVYRLGDRPGNDYFYEEFVVKQLKYRSIGEIITTDTEKKRVERSVIAMLDELKDAEDNEPLATSTPEEIQMDLEEIGW